MLILILKKMVAFCVNAVGWMVPKGRRRVFICDANARRDNTWAVAAALAGRGKRVTYYTEDLSIVRSIEGVTFTASRRQALWAFFRAYTVFWAYGPLRLYLRPRRGQRVVNLWHGSPLKDISFLAETRGFAYRNAFTAVLSPSAFFDPIMQKTFQCGAGQVVRLGAPRNDWLFSGKDAAAPLGLPKEKKLCVWMPTFRKAPELDRADSDIEFPLVNAENIGELDGLMGRYGYHLIIKPHPAAAKCAFLQRSFANIRVCFNEELARLDLEPYELLARTDLLLTDYSSVTFDFLLTGSPIGFIIDDIGSYGGTRGFAVPDPLSLMPGVKIRDMDGLEALLRDLSEGRDGYADERRRVCVLANEHPGGGNCERLLQYFEL